MSSRNDRPAFAEHALCPKARNAIASRQSELEDQLLALANINSGSHNPAGLEQVAAAILSGMGAFVDVPPKFVRDPDSGELIALQWKQHVSDGPRVLLNGHLDTVYSPESPFQSCVYSEDRRRITGPGVTDMKGGLVILFTALRAFLESELAHQLSWEVLLTCDEEIGSFKSRTLLEESARTNDIGIVFESSLPDGSLIRNRMGTGLIVAESKGQAAHSGRDFAKGRNAVVALSRFLVEAHELNDSIAGGIINVAKVQGGGPANVVPDQAKAELNVRAKDADAELQILESLHSAAETIGSQTGCELALTGGFTRPPKTCDASLEQLMQAWEVTANAMGQQLTWKDTGGASDGNILQAAGLPNIDNLGASGNFIHSEKEYIECDSLVHRAQLVASFLINLAAGKLSLPQNQHSA